MDSRSRHLLKVETYAMAESRDVEVFVPSFGKDRPGRCVDGPIWRAGLWLTAGPAFQLYRPS